MGVIILEDMEIPLNMVDIEEMQVTPEGYIKLETSRCTVTLQVLLGAPSNDAAYLTVLHMKTIIQGVLSLHKATGRAIRFVDIEKLLEGYTHKEVTTKLHMKII